MNTRAFVQFYFVYRTLKDSTLTIPDTVVTFLAEEHLGDITNVTLLAGGHINRASRITTSANLSFILKENAIDRLFECEAAGLEALRQAGINTPKVFAVGAHFLLMEDLGHHPLDEPDWEAFGRAVAHLHRHTHDHFGYDYDNYLGPLPQINTWSDDGHEFFGQQRVLRYLAEPQCEQALTPQDRQNLERLVKRLPELVPAQPPVLVHGDLWHTNMLLDARRQPTLIDPAVYYGWAEADLSMTRQYGDGTVPPRFFDAYIEVNPLPAGWWDRLELLMIRQQMAVLAFFGNEYNTLDELRATLAKFG